MAAKKSNNNRPVLARRIKDRVAVTVYVDPELLIKLDGLRTAEVRSRGAMVHEIMRRYFTAKEAASA